MWARARARDRLAELFGRIGGYLADQRGVAAVEFALVVPLLLCMYFVTMEVSQGIETNKKVGRIASMVGDLVTQQQQTSTSELDAIMKIGESLLQPYNRSKPKITITAIEVTNDAAPRVEVVWFRKLDGEWTEKEGCTDETKEDITTIPASLNTPGTFIVRVETCLNYQPVISWASWSAADKQALGLAAAFSNLPMEETYYLRPRMSQQVTCSDC
jgi:Flp pilus assembly protein TadG